MAQETQRYAAIDIGTVTCRLLIADCDEASLHEVERACQIANLGEDVDKTGVLKPEAMKRVREIVAGYVKRIAATQTPSAPTHVIAVATSASRDAKNSAEFVAMLESLGVHLTVIPGNREAALSFLGAGAPWAGERIVVADVGGGSTELIAGIAGEEPLYAHSFNIGCRRVTERLLLQDPPTGTQIAAAHAWSAEEFAQVSTALAQASFTPQRLVAVAGTATTVVSIHEKMTTYDSARVHGYQVSSAVLDAVAGQVLSVPLEERLHITGLQAGRAPVIGAGMIIMQEVLAATGQNGFTVSESDILQGIIMDAWRKDAR